MRAWPILALLVGCAPAPEATPRTPPVPTPGPGEEGEEAFERLEDGHDAWIAEMHEAPPGVDWRAIEARNAADLLERRNRVSPLREGVPTRWVERGSDNQAGRMYTAKPSTDGEALYAGSADGGVWRGTPDGEGWEPLGDGLYGGVHWLLTLPPDETGAEDVMLVATDGGAVHRSGDDGKTWVVPSGLPSDLTAVRRLVVGGDGLVWLVGTKYWYTNGVWRSTDHGRSFVEVLDLGGDYGDLWVPRDGGSGVYVLDGDAIRYSGDDGASWETRGSIGLGSSWAELAGSEAGAPLFWAAVHVAGNDVRLEKSDDGGWSWEDQGSIASDYWNQLDASIVDPDTFVYGGMEVHVTEDGGASWRKPNDWWTYYDHPSSDLHADTMGFDVIPDGTGGETWYVGTDGGLFRSANGLKSWQNLSLRGLRVSQYYGTLTSSADPTHVYAGAQDQGWQRAGAADAVGEDRFDFDQVISGDYAHVVSEDGTHGRVFADYPGFLLIATGEDDPVLDYAEFPSGESYAWMPPLTPIPGDPEDVLLCASHLYRYSHDDRGWTSEKWSEQDFQASNGEYVGALAFSPADPSRAYVVTSAGRLFWSDDGGVTWTKSKTTGPSGQYFYGTALVGSREDALTAWVGGSGYGATSIWRTTDGGQTWKPFDDGLPQTMVYAIVEAADGSGRLFAGTETAAYERDPDADAWVDISTPGGAPVTIYWSAEALTGEDTIRFGTYGRGIWDYQLDPEHLGCFPAIDHDGDGVACDEDCDDADPTVFPGNEDACDGVDANCDPADPDEADADGDGALACADCDDGDPDVSTADECEKRDRREARTCGCDESGGASGVGALVLGAMLGLAYVRRRDDVIGA